MLRQFKAVIETRYLSETNYTRYRPIMRLFYLEHQKMRYQMEKDELLALLREETLFQDYSAEQLEQDLDQLVKWKSLVAIQNAHRPHTIEEFTSRQYQYMMTPAAFQIEQMTVTLEGLSTRVAGLPTYVFARIQDDLTEMSRMESWNQTETLTWWNKLKDDFQRLSESYQEYLRNFHISGTKKKRDAAAFVAYKRSLIPYLENFIQDLQSNVAQIRGQLDAIPPERAERVMEMALKSELALIPAEEQSESRKRELIDKNEGIWRSLTVWFSGRESTAQKALDITNEIIREVVHNAALLVQMEAMGSSNKTELRHFMRLFAQCASTEEAHRLSAMVFGVGKTRHFTRNFDEDAAVGDDCLYLTSLQDCPLETALQPRIRSYKPRMERSGFADRSEEKNQHRQRLLDETQRLRTQMEAYIQDGILDFSKVSESAPLTPSVRTILLAWLTLAETAPNHRGRTEYGRSFILEKRPGVCRLFCTDGTLTMPNCVLRFEEESHG